MLPSDFNFLPFETSSVPEEYFKKAELELNETPETRVQKIKELRDLVAADKIAAKLLDRDDDDCVMVLRSKKFDTKRSFDNIKNYINYRKRFNYIFTNPDSAEYLKTGTTKWLQFLPYRCQDGCAIIVMKMENWNASETSLADIQRFFCFFMVTAVRDPMTQINGFKIIADFGGNFLKYMRHITPVSIYSFYQGTFNCLHGRFKGVHVMYPQLPFKIAYTLIKPFFSEKIKSRVFIHDSNESLLQHFPKQVLPVEYDGDVKEYSNMDWIKRNSTPVKLDRLFPKINLD